MAILAFQKPDKVVMLEANDKFGKFEFRPLEPGFGITIGNALRRIYANDALSVAYVALTIVYLIVAHLPTAYTIDPVAMLRQPLGNSFAKSRRSPCDDDYFIHIIYSFELQKYE